MDGLQSSRDPARGNLAKPKENRSSESRLHLRIPSVVLDHVGQFDNEFAFLVLLTRFERVFLSIQSEM